MRAATSTVTKGNEMATRTRTKAAVDINLDDVPDAPIDAVTEFAPPRKYMSHEHCGHARKGEAGKNARANCRRAHRAWFAAEIEYMASLDVAV